jgi:hypothetical protein
MPQMRPLVGLWVDDFTDWGGLDVLNSHTGGPAPPGLIARAFRS